MGKLKLILYTRDDCASVWGANGANAKIDASVARDESGFASNKSSGDIADGFS